MATTVADATKPLSHVRAAGRITRFAWLAVGCACGVVACGGRWDIALAAWLAPIFLLRFSRTSCVPVAIVGLFAAALTQNFAYFLLTAIPFNPLTTLLCVVVSVAYAIPAIFDRFVARRNSAAARLFLYPTAMVVIEFAAGSVLPVGTAIGLRAITQGDNLSLLQVIAITGPYGVAFVIGWTATVTNELLAAPTTRSLIRYGAPLAATLAIVIAGGQARLALAPATATMVKVAAISPDLHLRQSSDVFLAAAGERQDASLRAVRALIVDDLLARTRSAAAAGARIVAWSETAAPTTQRDKPALLMRIAATARASDAYVNATIGIVRARNETFFFAPDGRLLWHYRKNHPVPGMEPVPPFANSVPVAETSFGRVSNLICFDGDFPALARVDADVMLEPSWDWPEVAYAHTFRMLRLRAIENGYALVRPVFNGITGAFDAYGRPLAMRETMSGGTHVVLVDIPLQRGRTTYNLIGDAFAWLCALGAGACLFAAVRSPRDVDVIS